MSLRDEVSSLFKDYGLTRILLIVFPLSFILSIILTLSLILDPTFVEGFIDFDLGTNSNVVIFSILCFLIIAVLIFLLIKFYAHFPKADRSVLTLVSIGGIIGGTMYPFALQFVDDANQPATIPWVASAVLGILAAGFTVFVVANVNKKDTLRLVFLSILSGLTFPTVLNEVLDTISKAEQESQTNIEATKNKIANPSKAGGRVDGKLTPVALSKEFVDGTNSVRAEYLSNDTMAQYNSVGKSVVDGIVESNAEDSEKIEGLKRIGLANSKKGFTGLAVTAAIELQKIDTDPVKANAQKAAAEILDQVAE